MGTPEVYAVSIVAYIPIYLCMPIMNALAKRAGQVTPLVWTLLALVEMACTFAYTLSVSHLSLPFIVNVLDTRLGCMYIFITNASPSPSALGRTQAAAQTTFHSWEHWTCRHNFPRCCISAVQSVRRIAAYIVMAAVGFAALVLASLLRIDKRRLLDEPL